MTGDTIDSLLGMLAIDPGQKDASCVFLVTGETVADLFLGPSRYGSAEKKDSGQYTYFFSNHSVPLT
jgi:hypothetical protein